jgi:DNA helicase HerA-like ATPase
MRSTRGNDLILGKIADRPESLGLSRATRHLYICATGTGKSKFLENLIRQAIRELAKSKCAPS